MAAATKTRSAGAGAGTATFPRARSGTRPGRDGAAAAIDGGVIAATAPTMTLAETRRHFYREAKAAVDEKMKTWRYGRGMRLDLPAPGALAEAGRGGGDMS